MKKLLLLTLLSCASSSLFAQNTPPARPQAARPAVALPGTTAAKGNGKISGVVIDANTKKPVEFATVSLLSKATNKPVDGTVSDEKGRFTLNNVADGEYNLSLTFIGYDNKIVNNVTVADGRSNVDLGQISLGSSGTQLKEITVVGERPLVEDKIDRTVYNAEADISNLGGSAADVLRKVPSLSVDLDGNVELRGSSNVRVLINNKPSSIMASSVADALRQIPADMIKSVEVITSPSAKYDAEGTAGIINIITKKNNLQGLNGSVNLSGGTRMSNGNGNINYRQGKLGLNANLGTFQFYSRSESTTEQRTFEGTPFNSTITRTLDQAGENRNRGGGLFGQVGFDYDFDSLNTLSGGVRLNRGSFKNKGDQYAGTRNYIANTNDSTLTQLDNNNSRSGIDLNLDFTHTFKKQHEWSFLTQYTNSGNDSKQYQDLYRIAGGENSMIREQRNTNDGSNQEFTLQTDYTQAFKNNQLIEVGAKAIMRQSESDAYYRYYFPADPDSLSNNLFNYDQDVVSGYLSYGFTLAKKYNFRVGSRYEYTHINGEYETTASTSGTTSFTQDYGNFIPNALISRSIGKNQTLKVSYNRRIQRPQLFFLNPYLETRDAFTAQQGNPNLDAELTDSYELGYNTFFKSSSINASVYMRRTNNAIQQITDTLTLEVNGAPSLYTLTTFENAGKNFTYGLSLSGSTKPIPAWTINGNFNVYYNELSGALNKLTGEFFENSGVQFNINFNTGYDFGNGLSAQFNGGFNSRRITLQGKNSSFQRYGFAMRKELFEKKGGVSLGIDNPFTKGNKMYSEQTGANFYFNNNNQLYNRSIRISFDYRFGKMDFKAAPRRKKSIRNDDALQGDNTSQGN